jgi:hypothetical protein
MHINISRYLSLRLGIMPLVLFIYLLAAFSSAVADDTLAVLLNCPAGSWNWARASDQMNARLKDINSYLLAGQATIVGLIVPLALTAVTTIAARTTAGSKGATVRTYYDLSRVQLLIFSGIALLLITAAQLFWPIHFTLYRFGYASNFMLSKILLTASHGMWFIVNLILALSFIRTTLDFISPVGRRQIRKSYVKLRVLPRLGRHG